MDKEIKLSDVYPVITLYQPWATWIMRGWKTIETRTHDRFRCLNKNTILIHAGLTTDANAIRNKYLTHEQLIQNPDEVINGYILGFAYVYNYRPLNESYSQAALIDCGSTERFGLFLRDIKAIDPISVRGEMGVWYFNIEKMGKVKKSKPETLELF